MKNLCRMLQNLQALMIRRRGFSPKLNKYQLDAFHQLHEGICDNLSVPVNKQTKFQYKKASKYEPHLPRRERKFIHLKSLHNLSGNLDKVINWLFEEEGLFHKLGVKSHKKDDTYLADFFLCWLCVFVFPEKEGDIIRLGVLKVTCHSASRRRVSLAVFRS